MRKTLIGTVLLLSAPAFAQDLPWEGIQSQTLLCTEFKVPDDFTLGAFAGHFWVPRQEVQMCMGYIGPMFGITDHTWIQPMVGVIANWVPESDAGLVALMGGTGVGNLSVTLDVEYGWYNGDQTVYYGWYNIDFGLPLNMNAGIHAEQVDGTIRPGPHLGISNDHIGLQFRELIGILPEDRGHTLRIVVIVNL